MFFEMHGAEIAGCYGAVLEKGHPVLYCMLSALNLVSSPGRCQTLQLCALSIFPIRRWCWCRRWFCSVFWRPWESDREGFYNIYSLYATNAVFFQKDWMNFLTVFLVTAVPALIFTVLCGIGLKRRL